MLHCAQPANAHQPPGEWEDTACPLCGAREEELLIEIAAAEGPHRVVRCRACDLGYLNPRPTPASIGKYYPDDYGPYHGPQRPVGGWWERLGARLERLVMARDYGYPPPLKRLTDRLLAALARWGFGPKPTSLTTLPFVGEGRLLDFGCGSGWFAHRMSQRGWRVTGIDFSASAARSVSERYGLPVLVGSLPHPELKPETFDVVTMGQVLEHLHDPHRIVAEAARLLRPGGRLVVAVPNRSGWGSRYFGRDWWGLDVPRHLSHFTPATLRRLVESHGLVVRDVTLDVRAGWLRSSLKTARRNSAPSSRRLLARLASFRPVLSLIARWTGWTGQADSIRLIAERPAIGSKRAA